MATELRVEVSQDTLDLLDQMTHDSTGMITSRDDAVMVCVANANGMESTALLMQHRAEEAAAVSPPDDGTA